MSKNVPKHIFISQNSIKFDSNKFYVQTLRKNHIVIINLIILLSVYVIKLISLMFLI